MVELRGEARLVEEHLHELLVVGEVVVQALDDDVLLEAGRAADAREVDLGHAAEGEQRQDLVLAEPLSEKRPGTRRNTRHLQSSYPDSLESALWRRSRSHGSSE